jgi:hypothetical protein
MAIVYGIEGKGGMKATVIDGVYADPALSAFAARRGDSRGGPAPTKLDHF